MFVWTSTKPVTGLLGSATPTENGFLAYDLNGKEPFITFLIKNGQIEQLNSFGKELINHKPPDLAGQGVLFSIEENVFFFPTYKSIFYKVQGKKSGKTLKKAWLHEYLDPKEKRIPGANSVQLSAPSKAKEITVSVVAGHHHIIELSARKV